MTNIAGNANNDGVINPKTRLMLGASRPGSTTRGPGKNKPRIHLVSSKGKVPAAVIAEAVALKQKNQAKNATPMPSSANSHPEMASESDSGRMQMDKVSGGNPKVSENQLKNPAGVAPRPAPKHQNNPAYAGRFTPQGLKRDA